MWHLTRWVTDFPGLLWQIELPKSKLCLFNSWQHPLLGQNTALLLKDRNYRKQVVHRDDMASVEEFWDNMLGLEPAAVSFRLKEQMGKPLILQGWARQQDSQLYCGMLQYDKLRENQNETQDAVTAGQNIFLSKLPALIVDINKKLVIKHNNAAHSLFSKHDSPVLPLHDIFPDPFLNKFLDVAQEVLKHEVWSGLLSFASNTGMHFTTLVKIADCTHNGVTLLRITFQKMPRHGQLANIPGTPRNDGSLAQRIQSSSSLKEALGILLAGCSLAGVDGLMFSDIHIPEGLVQVYAAGTPFTTISWGAEHAYEGTIAQDIERFNLSSLIVDDTRDSIKSIDWVLFNPNGVRSYFAKPFFGSTKLHAVLIFTSNTPGAFPADSDLLFSEIYPLFSYALERWRKDRK